MFLVQCSFIAASKKFKMLTSISYNILTLDDQSGSRIFNPALWLVSQQQILGGNFKLVGNLIILVSYKNYTKEYISNDLILILLKFQEPTPVWSLPSENSYQKNPIRKITPKSLKKAPTWSWKNLTDLLTCLPIFWFCTCV